MKVSVLLPVFNAQSTLAECMKSILSQSFVDFECIVINDGSTDYSEEIISSFHDERIVYIRNEKNLKLIQTLNLGLKMAQGEYIVRMDADDIMRTNRLERQVTFMDNNPDIILSGSFYHSFGKIQKNITSLPITDEELRLLLIYTSPFCHPTTIIRRSVLLSHLIKYDQDFIHAEDYKLWFDLSQIGKIANLGEILLDYRISDGQISTKFRNEQLQTTKKIRKEIVDSYLSRYEENLEHLNNGDNILVFIKKILLSSYKNLTLFEQRYFCNIMAVCLISNDISSLTRLFRLFRSGLLLKKQFPVKYVILLILRCLKIPYFVNYCRRNIL